MQLEQSLGAALPDHVHLEVMPHVVEQVILPNGQSVAGREDLGP